MTYEQTKEPTRFSWLSDADNSYYIQEAATHTHTSGGTYRISDVEQVDILAGLKAVGSYNQNKDLRKAWLGEMVDRFGDWCIERGHTWDQGVDLGIYLHHRLGKHTRKAIAETLSETENEVLNSIKKAERWIRKNDTFLKENFFSWISAIEGSGYCYPTHLRPHFDFVPSGSH